MKKNIRDVEKLINSVRIDIKAMKDVELDQNQPGKTDVSDVSELLDGKPSRI